MGAIDQTIRLLDSSATDGYADFPIPSPIDAQVRALLAVVIPDGANANESLIGLLSERVCLGLVVFAERMSALAVRQGDGSLLLEGMRALSIASCRLDYKEVLPPLSLLYRSADIIGLQSDGMFDGIFYPSADFEAVVEDFLSRSIDDKSIASMGYSEGTDRDGFRYQYKD